LVATFEETIREHFYNKFFSFLSLILTLMQFQNHLGATKINSILGYFRLEYESLKELFTVVKVKNNPLKHCSNTSDCEIIKGHA
jgi:hypothetical protein